MDQLARNRALLARQLLLERSSLRPLRVLERLVGMQAQTPRSPYTAMWSRVRDFGPMALSRLLESRRAVRIALMRSTIHLVSAADALTLRPLVFAAAHRRSIQSTNGVLPGTLLVDGRVGASWRIERDRPHVRLVITRFDDLRDPDAVREEARGLLSLLAADAERPRGQHPVAVDAAGPSQ